MVGWGVGGLVVALGLVLLALSRKYRRLFSDAHFLEVARALSTLKAAALERADDANRAFSPADPRTLVTTAGLVVAYSISRHEGKLVHHFSVSVLGGVTAHAVGTTFVAWLAMLAGLPIDQVELEVGRSTVHHGEVILAPDEHDRVAKASALEVTQVNVAELRRVCFEPRFRSTVHAPTSGMG